MQRHLIALAVSVSLLLAVGSSACGSQAASVSQGSKACIMTHHGVKSRIQPENSGLPCGTIRSILMVLSAGPGVTQLENENGEPNWVCRVYPKSALPREIRCHEDGRHFERVRISS